MTTDIAFTLGITLFSLLAVKAVLSRLPGDLGWYRLIHPVEGGFMRKRLILSGLMLLAAMAAAQSTLPRYDQRAGFLLAAPGAFDAGLYGFINPATLGYLTLPEAQICFGSDASDMKAERQWGIFAGSRNAGFGWLRQGEVDEYRFALSGGEGAFSMGVGYGWTRGALQDHKLVSAGTLLRPGRFVSIGLSGLFSQNHPEREGLLELALRPLGTDRLTLFGDLATEGRENLKNSSWSTGAVVKLLPGLHLTARRFDTRTWSAGLSFSLGAAGLFSQRSFAKDDQEDRSYYGIRLGGRRETLVQQKKSRFYSQTLRGGIRYQKFRWFDDESRSLSGLLDDLQGVIDDPAVAGIALNLSGLAAGPEMVWELREKLKAVRQADKHIIVFLERGGMTEYHLASIADCVVLDPEGMLQLQGYIMGRTFQKEMLEKLGLGFDEWRFFKYKSANEPLSRDNMSDADREQRQALLDDRYAVVREDICSARHMSPAQFDALIDSTVVFNASDALKNGLADTLGRWIDADKIVAALEKGKKPFISGRQLAKQTMPRLEWGARPKIALVYALGVCDLESGIRARKLEKIFAKLTGDRSIKAVILRVDSPGGDGLASDLVAEAMKKCSEKKPVIVTQGSVAASGGYWLSMYADTVVSAPFSITGSIGVIGGWVWNKGLGDKLGLKSDHVQVGDHADLGFGIQLPIVGLQVPDRNLTPEERSRMEQMIRSMYNGFVGKVAAGRGLSADSVGQIAQGRVWSGLAAQKLGLVDVIGGMEKAIALAREAAGIPASREITLIEYPRPALFEFSPFFSGARAKTAPSSAANPEWEYLKTIAGHPGQPLPLLPPDYIIQ